jgi:hypothetical protein
MAPNKKKGGGKSNNKKGKGKDEVGRSKAAVTTATSSLSNNEINSPGPISESVLQNLTSNKRCPPFIMMVIVMRRMQPALADTTKSTNRLPLDFGTG